MAKSISTIILSKGAFSTMLKSFVRLSLVAGCLVALTCIAQNQHSTAHEKKAIDKAVSQQISPTHVIIDQPFPTIAHQVQPADNHNSTQEAPLPVWRRSEWVIVYVTVVYCVITCFMWRSMKQQTKIMDRQAQEARNASDKATEIAQKSAEAAIMQANHLISSERPWLVVRHNYEEPNTHLVLRFKAINKGKSPAKITFYYAQIREMHQYPAAPELLLGDGIFDEPQWLLSEEEKELEAFNPSQFLINVPARGYHVPDHVRSGSSITFFCGIVRYTDTLTDDIHETRFCYRLAEKNSMATLVMDSNKGFNTMS